MRGVASNQSYISNGYDNSRVLSDNYIPSRFDHTLNTINETAVPSSNGDLFGLKALRCSWMSPSRQPVSPFLNMTRDQHLSTNTDISGFEPSIMNIADRADTYGLGLEDCSHSPKAEEVRSNKLMLDLTRVKNLVMSSRNNGSPPFSDSSHSTGSSNLDLGFFPHSVQTGRSDSPNSVMSNSSNESTSNQVRTIFPQLTEQVLANLQNLHVINCMSNMSKEQCMQTINMLQSVLQNQQNTHYLENCNLELAAKHHRTAAVSGNAEAPYTWSGNLPKRSRKGGPYSNKVFLGGVPWDIPEEVLVCAFRQFGNIKVEGPRKDCTSERKGYAYVIFENEVQVKMLLEKCRKGADKEEGSFYYEIPTRKSKPKEVQVIPWSISDSNYSVKTIQKLEPRKTVFVGALHGIMNAEILFHVMNDLFEGVLYAGIDTDKNKYPIGSGRVTFDSFKSYVKAVRAEFVDIKTEKFTKKVQIDPYLEDTPCSSCRIRLGPYFCREDGCFRYFCTGCWGEQHTYKRSFHKPLMRNSKSGGLTNVAAAVPSHVSRQRMSNFS